MSLTQTHHVFAGVAESGINTFLTAFFKTRPHYLNYGSAPFVAASSVSATNVATVPFPGLPGGLPYAVSFSIPVVDLYPPNAGSTSPTPPAANQFGLHTRVKLTVGCFSWVGGRGNEHTGRVTPVSFALDVWALGSLVPFYFGPGSGYISLQVLSVRIPEIKPEGFEEVIDCVIRMLLEAALAHVQLPFHALSAGAFQLVLESGPVIDNNQVEVWGDI